MWKVNDKLKAQYLISRCLFFHILTSEIKIYLTILYIYILQNYKDLILDIDTWNMIYVRHRISI